MNIEYWKISTIVLTIIILFLTQCEREVVEVPVKIEVPVPAVKGKTDTIYIPKPVYVEVPEKGMNELLDKYASTMDSLERLKMYIDAITVREYNNTFENDTIKIDTWSRVRGELLAQSNDYFIKPYTIALDTVIEVQKPRFNALFLYGGIKSSIDFKTPAFEAKLIFKNKKDNLLSIGIDTKGNVSGGYGFKL